MLSTGCQIEEAKKAMPAEKLAELTANREALKKDFRWKFPNAAIFAELIASDPKRAGREARKKIYARKKKNSEMKQISSTYSRRLETLSSFDVRQFCWILLSMLSVGCRIEEAKKAKRIEELAKLTASREARKNDFGWKFPKTISEFISLKRKDSKK